LLRDLLRRLEPLLFVTAKVSAFSGAQRGIIHLVNAPPAVVSRARKASPEHPLLFDSEGLRPRWRALLFLAAVFILWPQTARPANWAVARGWINGLDEWTALMHLAAFAAVLIPTIIASILERRPLASYGLAWRQTFRANFWEGTAWGLGAIAWQVGILRVTHCLSFQFSALTALASFAFAGRWALTMLAVALFEECLKRGYLQALSSRTLGFWSAALVLGSVFGMEKLLDPAYRNPIAFVSVILYALLMCLTLKLTGDLWFAIGFHCAIEWSTVFVFGIGTPIIPHPQGTLLKAVFQGQTWITGGHNGLMASILTPVWIVLVWIALRLRFRQTALNGV